METRLKDVRKIVTEELAARDAEADVHHGVRGSRHSQLPGEAGDRAGLLGGRNADIARTNIAAFQQLWFDLAHGAARLHRARSSGTRTGAGTHATYNAAWYSMIGPASEGWPLFPSYHALRLLLQTTQQGWQVVQVAPWEDDDWMARPGPDQPEKEIAAYADDAGHLTLMGLDSHGRDLNAVSADPAPAYSIGGLPANTSFNLVLWNATGNGRELARRHGRRPTRPASPASRCRCTRRSR